MTQVHKRLTGIACATALAALLAGCGGSGSASSGGATGSGAGSSGGATTQQIVGIATPSSVSVVTATNAN